MARLEWKVAPGGEEMLVVGDQAWDIRLGEATVLASGLRRWPVLHTVRSVSEVWPTPGRGKPTPGVPHSAPPRKVRGVGKNALTLQGDATITPAPEPARALRGRPGKELPAGLLEGLVQQGLEGDALQEALEAEGVKVSRRTLGRRVAELRGLALQEA